jgi:hypothetical protein
MDKATLEHALKLVLSVPATGTARRHLDRAARLLVAELRRIKPEPADSSGSSLPELELTLIL